MSVEEEKFKAKAEKEYLATIIAMYSNDYKPDELRSMKLKKLQEIADRLNLL